MEEKSFDSLLRPLIDMCNIDTVTSIKQQETLLKKLEVIHTDLSRINDTHYHGKDEKINKYLDKTIMQATRAEQLTHKLESMQKRVQQVESMYNRLKEEIPDLKKHHILHTSK